MSKPAKPDPWQFRPHRKHMVAASLLFTIASLLLAYFIKGPAYRWIDAGLFGCVVLGSWMISPLQTERTWLVQTVQVRRPAHVGRYVFLQVSWLSVSALVMTAVLLLYVNTSLPAALQPHELPRSFLAVLFFFLPEWLFAWLGIGACYLLAGGLSAVRHISRLTQQGGRLP